MECCDLVSSRAERSIVEVTLATVSAFEQKLEVFGREHGSETPRLLKKVVSQVE